MDTEPAAEFTFVCPACGETLAVNGSMRDALVANGCVLCRTAVTPDAFTRRRRRTLRRSTVPGPGPVPIRTV